jgi:alkylhydroperoxidase family enzyme
MSSQTPAEGLPALGRFPGQAIAELNDAQRNLAAAFRNRRGVIPGPYKIWLTNPAFAAAQKTLSDHLLRSGLLSAREAEIAILVTAHQLEVLYIESAHRKLAAESGLSAPVIDAICAGETPKLASERERAVYEAALAMHTQRPADRALFDRARRVLDDATLAELAGLLGFYCACVHAGLLRG